MANYEFTKNGSPFGYEYALCAFNNLAGIHDRELVKDVAEHISDEPVVLARGLATLSMMLEQRISDGVDVNQGVYCARWALQIMSACVAAGIEIQNCADIFESSGQ